MEPNGYIGIGLIKLQTGISVSVCYKSKEIYRYWCCYQYDHIGRTLVGKKDRTKWMEEDSYRTGLLLNNNINNNEFYFPSERQYK